jgi:hypothetical protein
MIEIYARTFRIATLLDRDEVAPVTPRRRPAPALRRVLARWRSR